MRYLIRFEDTYGMCDLFCKANSLPYINTETQRITQINDNLYVERGFGYCIRQLTKTTFKKFGKLFKDTTYVMVVGDDSIWRDMYHDACTDK